MTKGGGIDSVVKDTAAQLRNNTVLVENLKPVGEEDLEYGDIVVRPLSLFGDPKKVKNFLHYAVYVGDGKVVQLGPDFENKKGVVRTSSFNAEVWGKARPPLASKKRDLDELKEIMTTLQKAEAEGKTDISYNVLLSNCERFANLVTYGTPYSSQYDELGTGAKQFSAAIANAQFGSFKGKSLHETFAHGLKYKSKGGIRKMPPIPKQQVLDKMINFSEYMDSVPEEDLKTEYETIRGRLAEVYDISEVDALDEALDTLNVMTIIQMVADDDQM